MKAIIYFVNALAIFSIVSIFMYAFLDIRLWIPTEIPSFREFLLMMIHVFSILGALYIQAVKYIYGE